jgi:hypothetical protein
METFFAEHSLEILLGVLGLLGGGIVLKRFTHRQSGSSNFVDQSNVRTRGDVVGRDKIGSRDEADRR